MVAGSLKNSFPIKRVEKLPVTRGSRRRATLYTLGVQGGKPAENGPADRLWRHGDETVRWLHAAGGACCCAAGRRGGRSRRAAARALGSRSSLEFLGELAGEDRALHPVHDHARGEAGGEGRRQCLGALRAPDDRRSAAVAWDTLDAPTQAARWPGRRNAGQRCRPERQHALADGAQRWLALDGIGRAQANDRWQTWRSLTPEQRERVQKAWARFRELTPEQQQAVRDALSCASRNCRRSSATG